MDVLLQQLVNGLSLGGTYALLALGLAIVFSVMGLINFAHGDLMTLTGYGMFYLLLAGAPFPLAVLVGIAVAVVAAVLMEAIAFRPLRGAGAASLLLSSFAVSSVLHILFTNLVSARPKAIPYPAIFTGAVDLGFGSIGRIQAISILVTLVSLLLLHLFLKRSLVGIAMRAAAQDFAAARVVGVRADRLIMAAFALSGLLAGIAGVLWIAQRGSVAPDMGFQPVLKAFIAVVLGGLGSLPGAVIGGVTLGVLEVMLRAYLPADALPFREAIALAVVIGVLLVVPKGLAGQAEAVR